jgi:hypothetical protein
MKDGQSGGGGERVLRNITILGTVHQLQGAEKSTWRNIEDAAYLMLVKRFLQGKDFIFEEASELGPTTAESLATEQLGAGHYLDVDPHSDHRAAYGIGVTGEQFPVDPYTQVTDFYHREFEGEQLKRENLWLGRIRATEFTQALLICGYLHTLSLAHKLRSEDFAVETWTYVPYLRLCPRSHEAKEERPTY